MNWIVPRGLSATMLAKMVRSLGGPKYDGKYLHWIVKQKLGDIRLHETLTNIVIPTFDIKSLQPTIFSSYQVSICSSSASFPQVCTNFQYFSLFCASLSINILSACSSPILSFNFFVALASCCAWLT